MRKLSLFILLILIGLAGYSLSNKYFTVHFDLNSDRLAGVEQIRLDSVVALCETETFSFIKIFGYEDPSETNDQSSDLSKKRALSVWQFIQSKVKLDDSKTYIEWLGTSDEIYDLHYENAHFQHPCVDIIVHLRD